MQQKENSEFHGHQRVSAQTKEDITYWTYRFACTEAELRDAVESVGDQPERVAEYIHILKGDKENYPGT